MESTLKRTWAEIDLDALAHNYGRLRQHIGPKVRFLGVVKADAYGHGAVECAKVMHAAGADQFAVATVAEGLALREAGIEWPILILSEPPMECVQTLVEHDIMPSVYTQEFALAYGECAAAFGKVGKYHLALETGMTRIGVDWRHAVEFRRGIDFHRGLACAGTFTHFATADVPGDWTFALQYRRFTEAVSAMREAGVSSFKTYFAYDHLRLDDAETLEVLEELKRIGGILCVHCENGTLVNELQKRVFEQGIHGPEGHALSRPDVCEAEAVSRLLYLAHLAGDAPVNVVHLSTKLGLEAIRAAKARGQKNIYVETCPQYLMLDDTCYLEQGEDGFAGAKYVMSPPLRHAGDRAALREALVAGEIDTIATDHCSFNLHGQKDRGRDDFRAIPNGGPGVEHRPVAIATSFEGQLGPEDLCRLMSENPARVFGMYPRKGCLAEGADADVCVWDPQARWTISAATQHQAVDYTPLEGFEAHGRAKAVFVNGVLAARDGEPTGAQPGRYVPR